MSISLRDRAFFHRAANLATMGEHRVRVGALAVANGKPIAGGFNTYRNNPNVTEYGNATYHAEINVLCQISPNLLPRVILYIARLDLRGFCKPSCPCDYCRQYIDESKIKSIVYLNRNNNLVKDRI